MNFWTILGAVASVAAAVGVTIQLTLVAFTRRHGTLGVSVTELPAQYGPPNSNTFMIVLRPMGGAVCSDLRIRGNPVMDIDDESPISHLDANSEPAARVISFPIAQGPDYPYEPRIVCAWISHRGLRPRPRALLVLPESMQVFDMRRSAIFWDQHFWKKRKHVRHPSVVHQTAATKEPLRVASH